MPKALKTIVPLIPAYLKKGDSVLVIGTARHKSLKEITSGIRVLESWGLVVIPGQHLLNQWHQFCGTDAQRTQDLQWAIDHPKAKAVFLLGGGYGTLRIIDGVSSKKLRLFPKWFIGFSDVTVLHAWLFHSGIASIHGPMVFQLNSKSANTTHLRKVVFGKKADLKLPPHPLNRNGISEGFLYGGNLSILYALSGSRESVPLHQPIILFIEDLDEYLYHIDRMMLQLKRSRQLHQLKGVLIGTFTDMKDNALPFGANAYSIIHAALKDFNYPVCFGIPSGHGKIHASLKLGAMVRINVQPKRVQIQYLT